MFEIDNIIGLIAVLAFHFHLIRIALFTKVETFGRKK